MTKTIPSQAQIMKWRAEAPTDYYGYEFITLKPSQLNYIIAQAIKWAEDKAND